MAIPIQVRGEVIRILDIAAPEEDQFCSQAEGDTTWRCGEQAAFALIDVIGTQLVTCETDKRDRYGAHLAGCMAGETNLGEWMAARVGLYRIATASARPSGPRASTRS